MSLGPLRVKIIKNYIAQPRHIALLTRHIKTPLFYLKKFPINVIENDARDPKESHWACTLLWHTKTVRMYTHDSLFLGGGVDASITKWIFLYHFIERKKKSEFKALCPDMIAELKSFALINYLISKCIGTNDKSLPAHFNEDFDVGSCFISLMSHTLIQADTDTHIRIYIYIYIFHVK